MTNQPSEIDLVADQPVFIQVNDLRNAYADNHGPLEVWVKPTT